MPWKQTRTADVELQSLVTSALDAVVSFMPWPIYPPGKNPGRPLNSRLGGTQRQNGCCKDRRFLPWPEIEPWII
jgi:hypothetical protein